MSVGRTVPQQSCVCPGVCTSIGRMIIHCKSTRTQVHRHDCFILNGNSAQKPADAQPQWQGYSTVSWAGTPIGRGTKVPGPAGGLRVVTTGMKAGYLRKNGVPYSDKATLEEYFDTFTEPDNNSWLVVTSIVTDPQYLTEPYTYTVQFKKLPDGQGWDPTPCRADQVR